MIISKTVFNWLVTLKAKSERSVRKKQGFNEEGTLSSKEMKKIERKPWLHLNLDLTIGYNEIQATK